MDAEQEVISDAKEKGIFLFFTKRMKGILRNE